MLNIKHTICPSCSVGCGINLVSNDETIVGTYPYKRHPINEGKNCLNGRYCFKDYVDFQIKDPSTIKNNELIKTEIDTILDDISKEMENNKPEDLCILCSGNSTNEELEFIKSFTEEYKNNLALYEYNFTKTDGDLASYDDINNAKSILAIGDIFNENPLIGRRIVLALENGAKLYCADTKEGSVTSINSDEYIKINSVSEFLENPDNNIIQDLNEDSVIIFNKVDSEEDCEKILDLAKSKNAKFLPVLKNCNSNGGLNIIGPSSKEEIIEILSKTKVLIVINDVPTDYLGKDALRGIKTILSISSFENDMTRISNYVIPGKPWGLKEGSFTNAAGTVQEFSQAVFINDENLTEIEVLSKLAEKLGVNI